MSTHILRPWEEIGSSMLLTFARLKSLLLTKKKSQAQARSLDRIEQSRE